MNELHPELRTSGGLPVHRPIRPFDSANHRHSDGFPMLVFACAATGAKANPTLVMCRLGRSFANPTAGGSGLPRRRRRLQSF